MSEWQPIETAPKDGSEIDVWCHSSADGDNQGYRVENVWYCLQSHKWRSYIGEKITWAHQPTHWQPLPEPPKE